MLNGNEALKITALDDSPYQNVLSVKSVTISMENGTTSLRVDIQCLERSLIIDTGSNVSILQPGESNNNLRGTPLKPDWWLGKP